MTIYVALPLCRKIGGTVRKGAAHTSSEADIAVDARRLALPPIAIYITTYITTTRIVAVEGIIAFTRLRDEQRACGGGKAIDGISKAEVTR